MRITNHIRDCIENALISHAFDARSKAMDVRENDIALRVYRLRVPEVFERKLEAADEARIPLNFQESFLSRIMRVHARRAGMNKIQLKFTHSRVWTNSYTPDIAVMDDDEVCADLEQFAIDREELKSDQSNARAEIQATLEPIFTAKALRAAWPEVMSIAEPILIEAGMQLKPQALVVATEGLNSKLGLPADVKENELEDAS